MIVLPTRPPTSNATASLNSSNTLSRAASSGSEASSVYVDVGQLFPDCRCDNDGCAKRQDLSSSDSSASNPVSVLNPGTPSYSQSDFVFQKSDFKKDRSCDYVIELGGEHGAVALFRGGKVAAGEPEPIIRPDLHQNALQFFKGTLSKTRAEKMLRKNPMILYYMDTTEGARALSTSLQLFLAFRRGEQVNHYAVLSEVLEGWKCFRLNSPNEPRFPSIEGLAVHYSLIVEKLAMR